MVRSIGATLRILAGALWIQFLANQLFDPLREGTLYNLRAVFNLIMAACILAVIAIGFIRKAEVRLSFERYATREYIESNFMAYGGIVLLHAFLWNWIGSRSSSLSLPWLWIVIETSLPVLTYTAGRSLTHREY